MMISPPHVVLLINHMTASTTASQITNKNMLDEVCVNRRQSMSMDSLDPVSTEHLTVQTRAKFHIVIYVSSTRSKAEKTPTSAAHELVDKLQNYVKFNIK